MSDNCLKNITVAQLRTLLTEFTQSGKGGYLEVTVTSSGATTIYSGSMIDEDCIYLIDGSEDETVEVMWCDIDESSLAFSSEICRFVCDAKTADEDVVVLHIGCLPYPKPACWVWLRLWAGYHANLKLKP